MNSFAQKFYLLVGASVPAAFGLLVSAIKWMQALNEISVRQVSDPNVIAGMKADAFAPTVLGFEVSIPLWIVWGIYLLITPGKRKE